MLSRLLNIFFFTLTYLRLTVLQLGHFLLHLLLKVSHYEYCIEITVSWRLEALLTGISSSSCVECKSLSMFDVLAQFTILIVGQDELHDDTMSELQKWALRKRKSLWFMCWVTNLRPTNIERDNSLVYAIEILKLDLSMILRGRSNFNHYLVISLPSLISSLKIVYLDITFVEKPNSSQDLFWKEANLSISVTGKHCESILYIGALLSMIFTYPQNIIKYCVHRDTEVHWHIGTGAQVSVLKYT